VKNTTQGKDTSDATVLARVDDIDSCYFDLLLSRVAPALSGLFRHVKGRHHSLLPLLSLVVVLASSALVLDTTRLASVWYRVLLAVTLHLALIVDVTDDYLKRSAVRVNKMDAWLGKAFDRLGMMIVFVCFGFSAWRLHESRLFIYLGIAAGFAPSLCSLAISTWEFALLDEKSTPAEVRAVAFSRKTLERQERERGSNTGRNRVLRALRCFLNPGIGERYLLLSVFVLAGRIDVVLGIVALLSCIQAVNVYRAIKKKSRIVSEKIHGKTEYK
jgi:hypothetical protein